MQSHNTTAPKGEHNHTLLNDTNAYPWFPANYGAYQPDPAVLKELQAALTTHEILAFGGTWCGDTRYLLPKFYKVMDALPRPPKVTLILVDNDKKSGTGIEANYNIQYVPTFIVLLDGKEIGRVVETVETNIEQELLDIVKPAEVK